jgi:hypothetical protein
LCPGLHGDDPAGSSNLEFEVPITGDGHELEIARPPQDDMVRVREIDYFKHEHFSVVVACVSEDDRQGNPPKGDGLPTEDISIEWVWAILEMVLGESQSLNGVEVHEVEAASPSMSALVSQVVPTSGSMIRGNHPGLGMLYSWSIRLKVIRDSDQCRYSGTDTLTKLITRPVSLSLRCDTWGADPS